MSVEASAWVWAHSQATGAARLVLLRIADQCDKFGANSWPGTKTIEHDCRITRKTRRAAFAELVKLGELVIYENRGGNLDTRPDRRPNRYDLPKVPGYTPPTGGKKLPPGSERGGNLGSNGGVVSDETGGYLVPPYPSLIHPDPAASDSLEDGPPASRRLSDESKQAAQDAVAAMRQELKR